MKKKVMMRRMMMQQELVTPFGVHVKNVEA